MNLGRWWRAYDDAVHHPKLQRLSGNVFKGWFNLVCLASANDGVLPGVEEIAYALRKRPDEIEALIAKLRDRGLIDDLHGSLRPHNWQERQFASDLSTERVKRYRQRQRNVSETAPDTDTDSETESETDQNPSLREGGGARAKAISSDWKPDDTT